MSLFRKVGRKFEETKRTVLTGGKSDYICRACEEGVTQEYDNCPHCGAAEIVPVE